MSAERSLDRNPSVPFSCIPHLLEHQAKRVPDAPAILAPDRAPLTYGRLYQHIDKMGRTLRALGIGRRDRVAVALPNGPELAVAILTVEASAVCAPVNPAYGAEELDRYFADLLPRALIIQAGIDSPARRVAASRDIRLLELSPAIDSEAGLFTLSSDSASVPSDQPVSPGDVARLLPTSGTTSRPKIVPQTHANLCASAYATAAALALTEADRCLNILPLFHGHGLNATVVASLAAGASVVCTPGFDANRFFEWLTLFEPTWYSAVPTMHQAILAQAQHHSDRLAKHRLRFVRSSSASLAPTTFADLERAFEAPVIEWYGMTEVASSPIACNPLPPRPRKAGSVGIPVDLDVAIMDEHGALLPCGQTGEIVVRGASVMVGYDGDARATAAALAGDWFRTGDLGHFDDDGYLFLTGRIREMINRGGEKVAPREVDEVLLEHPAVAEAVTFAVPHATLGEDVGAAIVLRPDAAATPQDIRRFATGRIADFKVPRQIVFVGQMPKGPTGKVQRIGLAAKLGIANGIPLPHGFVAPRTPLEQALATHWAEILKLERIGIHDDFFAAGGDSLLAAIVLLHIQEITQVEYDLSRFFESPTIAEVAHHLEQLRSAGHALRPSCAIPVSPRDNGIAPASFRQERFWKLQQALPGTPLFNIPYALRLTRSCDVAVLERSINEIVRRHEILRTTFAVVADRHVQVIASQLTVPLEFHDLHALPRSEKEKIGNQLIQEEVLHTFDLEKGPLLRTRLMRLEEREHLLLISMHQIICDGWSLGVFVEELVALYDAFSDRKESPLAPLSIQYADVADWQRHGPSEIVAQLDYWREQLRAPLPQMRLATANAARAIDNLLTARMTWTLRAHLADAVKRFSQEEGGTLFMALVAVLTTLLHRYLGQDDIRVATNVANRNRAGTESLIGPLVNTVILRTNLGGDPNPREVMRRVRTTTLGAFAHQDVLFEQLAETLERERAIRPASLAPVMILLQNATLRPPARRGVTLACEEANPNLILPLVTATPFDVILALCESTNGLAGTCIYKSHLFGAESIDRMLRNFETVVEEMAARPERPISEIRVPGR
jgi:acyl-CoA synthetase (AMP-forming)/AMP-acid ligase II